MPPVLVHATPTRRDERRVHRGARDRRDLALSDPGMPRSQRRTLWRRHMVIAAGKRARRIGPRLERPLTTVGTSGGSMGHITAVGRQLVIDRGTPLTAEVVGVVGDARLFGQESEVPRRCTSHRARCRRRLRTSCSESPETRPVCWRCSGRHGARRASIRRRPFARTDCAA